MTADRQIQDQTEGEGIVDLSNDFLTVVIGNQRFGIPIIRIQDVMSHLEVTKTPLAPPEVAGSLNLRGRIVTAVDVRCRLGIESEQSGHEGMGVVVEHEDELYSLVIDSVGDVLTLKECDFESNPATLDPILLEISLGIYRLENELLVILDVPKLLDTVHT